MVCGTDTAGIDIDPEAFNITWSLTPTNLFSGSTTGTGKVAQINAASSASGLGTITYNFEMPSELPGGETFSVEETFWVGEPESGLYPDCLIGPSCCEIGSSRNYFDGTPFPLRLGGAEYEWTLYPNDPYIDVVPYADQVSARVFVNTGANPGNYTLMVRSINDCDQIGETAMIGFEVPQPGQSCSGYSMVMFPNPSQTETTISVISNETEENFGESEFWDLAVYSENFGLKEKKTKLKGNTYKLNTSNWKEGVYIVHIKYKGKTIQGKLAVK